MGKEMSLIVLMGCCYPGSQSIPSSSSRNSREPVLCKITVEDDFKDISMDSASLIRRDAKNRTSIGYLDSAFLFSKPLPQRITGGSTYYSDNKNLMLL